MISENQKKTIICVGRTGAGKSTLCNYLANSPDKPVFKIGKSLKSETIETKSHLVTWKNLGKVEVIDTPGFADNSGDKNRSDQKILAKILSLVKSLGDGFHTCLYCYQAKDRPDKYDFIEMGFIAKIFSTKDQNNKPIFKNCKIVITQLNIFNSTDEARIFKKQLDELPGMINQKVKEFANKLTSSDILSGNIKNFNNDLYPTLVTLLGGASKITPDITQGELTEEALKKSDPVLSLKQAWVEEIPSLQQQAEEWDDIDTEKASDIRLKITYMKADIDDLS